MQNKPPITYINACNEYMQKESVYHVQNLQFTFKAVQMCMQSKYATADH